jgi:hypothetical protein
MKNIIVLCTSLFFLAITQVSAQEKGVRHTTIAPFQGTQHFCSNYKPVQYDVTIKGNKVSIVYRYKEYVKKVTGTFTHGKLFTNDPAERSNKAYASKYYKVSKTYLAVNNLEGGDYVEYDLCR